MSLFGGNRWMYPWGAAGVLLLMKNNARRSSGPSLVDRIAAKNRASALSTEVSFNSSAEVEELRAKVTELEAQLNDPAANIKREAMLEWKKEQQQAEVYAREREEFYG